MSLTLNVSGNTVAELVAALRAINEALSMQPDLLSPSIAKVAVETTTSDAPAKAVVEVAAPEVAAPEAPAPEVSVVKPLKPAEMIQQGTNMLIRYFNRDPNAANPKLSALQAKYGVKKFVDVAEDRAVDFYHDALLAVNGTAEKVGA